MSKTKSYDARQWRQNQNEYHLEKIAQSFFPLFNRKKALEMIDDYFKSQEGKNDTRGNAVTDPIKLLVYIKKKMGDDPILEEPLLSEVFLFHAQQNQNLLKTEFGRYIGFRDLCIYQSRYIKKLTLQIQNKKVKARDEIKSQLKAVEGKLKQEKNLKLQLMDDKLKLKKEIGELKSKLEVLKNNFQISTLLKMLKKQHKKSNNLTVAMDKTRRTEGYLYKLATQGMSDDQIRALQEKLIEIRDEPCSIVIKDFKPPF